MDVIVEDAPLTQALSSGHELKSLYSFFWVRRERLLRRAATSASLAMGPALLGCLQQKFSNINRDVEKLHRSAVHQSSWELKMKKIAEDVCPSIKGESAGHVRNLPAAKLVSNIIRRRTSISLLKLMHAANNMAAKGTKRWLNRRRSAHGSTHLP